MQEPYDWEQVMETTMRSAMAASQNSENAIAGISKLLREIDRHSCKLASLTKAINQLETTQGQQITRSQTLLDRAQGDNRGSPRLLALGFLVVFTVGVVFGGFIVS
jgi:hypothetical protein